MTGERPGTAESLVSVVIPTIGRPSLADAVRSALDQTWTNIEVVVCADGPLELVERGSLPDDHRLFVVATEQSNGVQLARGKGISESKGAFIALLDDDDVWEPAKIELQMRRATQLLESGSLHVIIGCRARVVTPQGNSVLIKPRSVPSPDQSVADFLLVRRHIGPSHTGIASSMLLFDRQLAIDVPFVGDQRIHEDWEWLIQAQSLPGTVVEFSPEVLLRYTQNEAGNSLSSIAGGRDSLAWLNSRRDALTARQYGDAVLCHSIPLALQVRDWREVLHLLRSAFRQGRPGIPAIAFFTSMAAKSAVPRSWRRRIDVLLAKMRMRSGTEL